jgi:hypothetical protein
MGGSNSRYVAVDPVPYVQRYEPPVYRQVAAPIAMVAPPIVVTKPAPKQAVAPPPPPPPTPSAPVVVKADLSKEKIYHGKVTPAQMAALVDLAQKQQPAQTFIGGYFVGGKNVGSSLGSGAPADKYSIIIMVLLFIIVIITAFIIVRCMQAEPAPSAAPATL